jgi:hypothetical protein
MSVPVSSSDELKPTRIRYRAPTVRKYLGEFLETWASRVSGGLSVPFAIVALFVPSIWAKVPFLGLAMVCLGVASYQVWRKEWKRAEEAERKLAPKLAIAYDSANSLFTPEHETYRLRVWNAGITAIDDVEVRITATPTLGYLSGYLPMVLREQHAQTGPPFTLKGNTPRYFDFLEYSEKLSAHIVNNGAQLVLFCHDFERAHRASFGHVGENVIEIEVSGRDVPPCHKVFRVRSLLPGRRTDGASLEVTEVASGWPDGASGHATL